MVKEEAAATEKENNNNNNTQPFLVFLITGFGGNAIVYGLLSATYAPTFRRSRKKKSSSLKSWRNTKWMGNFLIALFLPIESLLSINSTTTGMITYLILS